MNSTTASCGHAVVAVGAPGSAARREVESQPCTRCRKCVGCGGRGGWYSPDNGQWVTCLECKTQPKDEWDFYD